MCIIGTYQMLGKHFFK
jgi:hypothetical protein